MTDLGLIVFELMALNLLIFFGGIALHSRLDRLRVSLDRIADEIRKAAP